MCQIGNVIELKSNFHHFVAGSPRTL